MIKRLFSRSKPSTTTQAPTPDKTPYEIIGGEAPTRAIANRFYDIMASDEYAKPLYDMHPQPLDRIRQVFFEFLSGWLGGPDLFVEKPLKPCSKTRSLSEKDCRKKVPYEKRVWVEQSNHDGACVQSHYIFFEGKSLLEEVCFD